MNGIVTLDVGTTSIKGYLFSPNGDIWSQASHATPFMNGDKGFSEIDPDKVLGLVLTILNSLVTSSPHAVAVHSIVVSGMACSFIPVDRQGKPLHTCICWNDQRNAEAVDVSELGAVQSYIQQYPLPMYLPFRLKWFVENNPDIVTDAYKWLNLTDFIVYHLSAQKQFHTDYSQASRTMLFNSLTKEWNAPVIDHFQIPVEKLPIPKPSGFVIGSLDKSYELNPSYRSTQLLLGGHDHMFAALAGGVNGSRIALNSTGTSEALVLPYDQHSYVSFFNDEYNLESHVIDNELLVVGYVASTGSIMGWADRLFHLFKWAQRSDLDHLWHVRRDGLPLFIPSGRRMQPSRTGRLIGLQPVHDDLELSMAVMEGISFEAKVLLEHLNERLNMKTELVRVVGGSSKLLHFLQLKSSILQKPIEVIHDVDMTSLGAFILSGLALNHFDHVNEAVKQLLHQQKKTFLEPGEEVGSGYEKRYHAYLRERGSS